MRDMREDRFAARVPAADNDQLRLISFGSVDEGLNVGLVISIVLIILLIFLELSEPLPSSYLVLGRLRIRFTTMTAILFIIFMGIVYTKIVMILAV
jgi:hypothetical protein